MSDTRNEHAAGAGPGRAASPALRWGPPALPLLQGALALSLLPWLADAGRSGLPLAAALALASAVGFAVLAWAWGRRTEQRQADARRGQERMAELFDALPLGIVVYDRTDRLEWCNRSFRTLYTAIADLLTRGRPFGDLVRAVVDRGLVPEAKGREADWLEERLWQHGRASSGSLREMPDGRWRRIVEHRLSDGGLLAYSVDVTDLVRRERSSEAAHREAEAARTRLNEAIEALPAAFELFDADDRLVLCNSRLRALYPRIAHLMTGEPRFEDVVRAHRAAGGLGWVGDDFEGWLRTRLAQRRRPPTEPWVHPTDDGRWLRLHEQVTPSGGLVCVRIDVTDWVERGQEIARLRSAGPGDAGPGTGGPGPRGLHLTADLGGCAADAPMSDLPRLRALCLKAVADAGLQAVGEHFHAFPAPGGVTGVVLLAESHLAVHTWPEHAAVTLDVFVCNLGADNRERARRLLAAVESAFGAGRAAHAAVERSLAA